MAPAADPGVLLFPYYDMMNDTLGHMAPCETGILVEYSLVLAGKDLSTGRHPAEI